ncbi:hypothetical protein [Microbacterium soli]|uniref:Uncharacterized protein n=1 Tax=Microbacterium soli TaxID=446075 RepID=A0ABP7NE43_9MICO
MRRRAAAAGAILCAALLLAACASASPHAKAPTDAPADVAETPEAPSLTGADIQAWIANAEWSFADRGLEEPITIVFEDGKASDDVMRVYEIGVGVESDADGDGVVDLAVPVTQLDGNGFQELWYVWLGKDIDADAVAEQVWYPIARTVRCGDVVHSVEGTDGGFLIDQTLWMPHTDQGRDCAGGGTGTQTREIAIIDVDGVAYPVQTAPVPAWGGVCPRSEWLDGIIDDTVDGRVAPPASAPQAIAPGDPVGLYELPPAPLLTADGARFFGFQGDLPGEAGEQQVLMHCAFG